MSNKIMSVFISALPGVYRLVIVYLIGLIFVDSVAIREINIYVLATGICMFSSMGVAVFLVKNISGLGVSNIINSEYLSSIISILVLSLLSSSSLKLLNVLQTGDFFIFTTLLISLGFYQLERQFLIAMGKLKYLLIYDICLLISTVVLIFLIKDGLLSILISNFIIALAGILHFRKYILCKYIFNFESLKLGSKLGYGNLVSGGVMYLLPSIFAEQLDKTSVYVLSLAVTVSGVCLIIPRSILNLRVQKLSKDARSNYIDKSHYKKANKEIAFSCLVLFPVSLFTCYIYILINGVDITSRAIYFLLVSLMILVLVIGQLSLIDSTLLTFFRKENILVAFNTIILFFVFGVYMVMSYNSMVLFSGSITISIILSAMLALYTIRVFLLKRYINKL